MNIFDYDDDEYDGNVNDDDEDDDNLTKRATNHEVLYINLRR